MLYVETVAEEEVDVSMEEVVAEDVEKEVYEVENDTAEEVLEEAAANMKMELTSQMLTVTLKIKGGLHFQTIGVKGSPRTR